MRQSKALRSGFDFVIGFVDQAELIVSLGALRVDTDRLAISGLRLAEPLEFGQDVGMADKKLGCARPEADGSRKARKRCLAAAGFG
ncbi:MAG TPA: hypothetical protein VNK52_03240 [Hyphomicrobiaceae bacterium]|nr:hypothetical protein [Hyphomicrobiaceae bacterium]